MEIEIFSLCDGAFNYSGKLTIVSTYDKLTVPSIPVNTRSCLAVKLNFDNDEVRNGTTIKVAYKDPLDNPITADIVNTVGGLQEGTQVRHVAMALNTNLNITEPGFHLVEMFIDNVLVRRKQFEVVVEHQ